jgi:hypothetical protein
MDYDTFKSFWNSAFAEAGLPSAMGHPDETVDLSSMDRRYTAYVRDFDDSSEPFHISCKLSWRWDALQSARTATTEEDLLTQLHGRDEAADMDTERPWLRVDVELHGSLQLGEGQKMPGKATWSRFVAAVTKKVTPLLPVHEIEFNDGTAVLGWCGQPTATVLCEEDGRVKLTGVELSAYQPILLPRKWDDPEREPDEDPEEALAAFTGRVREAMEQWAEAVKVLRIVDVSLN